MARRRYGSHRSLRRRRNLLIALPLLTGCAHKPATSHLIAPPECVRIKSSLRLDSQGHIIKKQPVTFETTCTKVVQ